MRAEETRSARRLLAVLVLAATTAGTAGAQEPVYVRRLVMPVAEDTVGYPPGVTADLHTGEVFICDSRMNRVLVFDSEGLFLHEMPGGDAFTGPQDVAVDPDGLLVVAASRDRHSAVVELDFDGLFRREIRPSGLPRQEKQLPGFRKAKLNMRPCRHELVNLHLSSPKRNWLSFQCVILRMCIIFLRWDMFKLRSPQSLHEEKFLLIIPTSPLSIAIMS